MAAQPESPFPNTTFSAFSQIIKSNFGSKMSLATVLIIFFTLTENADLLNLHFRQQHPEYSSEKKSPVSGWMIALVNALTARLGKKSHHLFSDHEEEQLSSSDKVKVIAKKLERMAIDLDLTPYNDDEYTGKLVPVSLEKIQPVLTICPPSIVCCTGGCRARSLVQNTQKRDIPLVTLIKGNKIHKNVSVLTGRCPDCDTLYSADRERFTSNLHGAQESKHVYLNKAKFLKIDSSLWVDILFSTSIINAMYSFHASASACSQYWNITYGTTSTTISRAQIWQAFVQGSIQTVAAESNIELELNDTLTITQVTHQAFAILGEEGVIRAADKHACDECTQEYKRTSDVVFDNPAAVVGVDENHDVPVLAENVEVEDIEQNPQHRASPISNHGPDDQMDIDKKYVTLVTLDGVVMGPTVNMEFTIPLYKNADWIYL